MENRAKSGQIIIQETDKRGNMSVSSREIYQQQEAPHVAKEELVDHPNSLAMDKMVNLMKDMEAIRFREGE